MNRILIISKTKMANNRICVGGIDMDNRISVRLLDINGHHESVDTCQFNIRDIWNIEYIVYNQRPLPHSEDVHVISKTQIGVLRNDIPILDYLNGLNFPIYQNDILHIFEGRLNCTDSGTLYISGNSVPNNSTCFWICDREMRRSDYNGKIRYCYQDGVRRWGYNISYVGLENNPAHIIPRGTLMRLSLAHWWSPEDTNVEERCYLQLSGWY